MARKQDKHVLHVIGEWYQLYWKRLCCIVYGPRNNKATLERICYPLSANYLMSCLTLEPCYCGLFHFAPSRSQIFALDNFCEALEDLMQATFNSSATSAEVPLPYRFEGIIVLPKSGPFTNRNGTAQYEAKNRQNVQRLEFQTYQTGLPGSARL